MLFTDVFQLLRRVGCALWVSPLLVVYVQG